MDKTKYSRQREALIEELVNRRDHPNADEIYISLRERFPKLSLGTVYRNLSLLADKGIIMKIPTGDGGDRFDGDISKHYHCLCNQCQSIFDLEIEPLDYINGIAENGFSGKIIGHNILFHGICSKCSEKSYE